MFQAKHQILCRPWRCSPDAAYNEPSCESSSHLDGSTELPSCVPTFHVFGQNSSQHWWKCSWKGTKKLSVSPWTTGSWQVLTSTSWISPLGQPNQHCYSNELKILSSIHFPCDRDFCILQSAISNGRHIFSNRLWSYAFQKGCWWRLGNVHVVGPRFWAIQQQMAEWKPKSSTAIRCWDTWIFEKTWNILENKLDSLSIKKASNFFCTKCCDSCNNKKYETTHSALAQIILLICPICLFIQFSYFLVDDLVSNYGQQSVFQMGNNLFSSCHCGVTSGKVQGSELCLDTSISLPSGAVTRQVILGYKCVHEGCQKSFESRKGSAREIMASSAETSSQRAKSFCAALQMLNAQSFICSLGRRFAAALLPRLFGTNPRSHHKGATGRVQTGDQLLPVLCHCQLGQDIPIVDAAHQGTLWTDW